jgi:hypothetical protein
MIFFIAIFGQMNIFLFISKIRINIFSIKDHTKNTDNVFVYIFNKICANFAQVGRMKVKIKINEVNATFINTR